jgi:hypothetical protein
MNVQRVRYVPGQLLSADDYVDEQTYLLTQLRRAVLLLHGSGIVDGFGVSISPGDPANPETRNIVIGSGAAIDPTGRLFVADNAAKVAVPAGDIRLFVSVQAIDTPDNPVAWSGGESTEFTRWREDVIVSVDTIVPPDAVLLAVLDGDNVTMESPLRDHRLPPGVSVESLRRELLAGLSWVAFESNNEPLWLRVRQSLSDVLDAKWRAGSLVGNKSADAFFVQPP